VQFLHQASGKSRTELPIRLAEAAKSLEIVLLNKILKNISIRSGVLFALNIVPIGCGMGERSYLSKRLDEEVRVPLSINASATHLGRTSLDHDEREYAVPSSFVLSVSGCDSGARLTHDTSLHGQWIYLVRGDLNCVASLRTFVFGGDIYKLPNDGEFSGAGSAVFESATNAKKMIVKNPILLPAQISDTAQVQFSIQEVGGGRRVSLMKLGQAGYLSSESARPAPKLRWFLDPSALAFTNLSTKNLPSFSVKLECLSPLSTSSSNALSWLCGSGMDSQPLGEYYLKISKDSFNEGQSLTLSAAQRVFGYSGQGKNATPNGAGVVRITSATQILPPSGNLNGGVSLELQAENTLTDCRNYLLLVLHNPSGNRLKENWSFAYFNFDFASDKSVCPN
jgi:hypothetical protein